MKELRELEGIGAAALEFLILTVGRTAEVIGARWPEIDLANRVWIVPAIRMKNSREHRVPLSSAAIALLDKSREPAITMCFPVGARTRRFPIWSSS